MNTPLPDTVPARALTSRIRKFQGAVYVMAGEQAFELDDIAGFVYRQVNGIRSLADIGAVLAQEYAIDLPEAIADVTELIVELAEHQVVELREPTRPEVLR